MVGSGVPGKVNFTGNFDWVCGPPAVPTCAVPTGFILSLEKTVWSMEVIDAPVSISAMPSIGVGIG
jgi:hypothetical protein